MNRGFFALALIALAAMVGVGCGGGSDEGPTADDYRAQLNEACTALFEGIAEVSHQATDGSLEGQEISERADAIASEFETTVQGLEPPDELADAHEAMVALGDEVPPDGADIDAQAQYQRDNLKAFEALGAEECVAGERAAIEQLEGAN